jgi:hypothetical protein
MTAWHRIGAGALLAAVLATAVPAHADVIAQTDLGFVSRNVVVVAGSPAAVWKRLVTPSLWWSSDHTFSGDAANMTLDPVAGGCFCEKLPADDDAKPARPGAPHSPARGGVQHMRVVFVDQAKALRMVGGLGPLQSEAVSATLTITLKEVDGGTRVIFEYVVGGYMRYPSDKIANAVDIVMGNQLISLAKPFGPAAAPREENAPPPATGGAGLDKNGLLLPRGRVWSLPSGPPPEQPPEQPAAPVVAPVAAEQTPIAAPLPTAPVQDDLAPSGGTPPESKKRARKRAAPPVAPPPAPEQDLAPAPQDNPPAPVADGPAPVEAAPAPKPASKARSKAKKAAKPAPQSQPKPPANPDEPTRDSVNAAFDAAFGGAPRPDPGPQQ